MTLRQVAVAELVILSILLSVYVGVCQRKQILKWLAQFRKKLKRQLRPNTPHDCPACMAAPSSSAPSSPRPRAWSAEKQVQGRKKQAQSEGHSCPNQACAYFKVTDSTRHALVSNGWRGKQERIRQWRCQACGKSFSSRHDTAMYYLKTPSWRVGEILTALGEGVDLAASSRIFRHHVHTVVRWQRRGAEHAERLQAHWLVNLRLTHLQLDELVVRVRSQPERVFVWTVIDSLTKVLVSIHVGSRKKVDAMQVVHDTKSRLHPDCVPVFTSYGINQY